MSRVGYIKRCDSLKQVDDLYLIRDTSWILSELICLFDNEPKSNQFCPLVLVFSQLSLKNIPQKRLYNSKSNHFIILSYQPLNYLKPPCDIQACQTSELALGYLSDLHCRYMLLLYGN